MIRVVLVDDEKWSLYGLLHLIEWEKYGCEIAGTASDGREALEVCREQKPDLLITDICMPDMSGLELAQTILQEHRRTAIVFITGHEEIRYAQAAIRLGVFDYLLKPIDPADLTEMIRTYTQHRLARKRQPSDNVFFTLFDESNTASIEESLTQLSIPPTRGKHVRAMTFQYAEETAAPRDSWREDAAGGMAVFQTGRFRLTLFLVTDTPLSLSEEQLEHFECAEGLQGAQHIGISLDFPAEGSFREAYLQSCTAVDTAAFWKQKWKEYRKESGSSDSRQELKKMKSVMKTSGYSQACVRVWLGTLRGLQLDALEKQVNEGLWLVSRYLEGGDKEDGAVRLSMDEFEDFSQIEDYFLHLNDSSGDEDAGAEMTVRKVLEYMEEHYTEKISLTMIARKFYINPCYLSTLIHDITGKTYSELITGKRMNLVLTLLENTQLSVTDIAEKAGYNVYSHFLNLFKRETGQPPSVWRACHTAAGKETGM